jgi:hypothetical protein
MLFEDEGWRRMGDGSGGERGKKGARAGLFDMWLVWPGRLKWMGMERRMHVLQMGYMFTCRRTVCLQFTCKFQNQGTIGHNRVQAAKSIWNSFSTAKPNESSICF